MLNRTALKFLLISGIACLASVGNETTMKSVKLNNIKCTNLDIEFSEFYRCKLNAINRYKSTLSVGVHLYKVPITNISIRFRFMRKSNGYKPFLYDFTVDACKLLRFGIGRNHPFVNYIMEIAMKYSNMNHTCPYNHDIILENFTLELTPNLALTFLSGEYALYTTWYAYNKARADGNIYFVA